MTDSVDRFCPKCAEQGVLQKLLVIDSVAGTISNLCSSPSCNYPFSVYHALLSSVERTVPDKRAENEQTVEEFLSELLDETPDLAPPDAARSESAYIDAPSKQHPQFSLAGTVTTNPSAAFSSGPTVNPISSNCMLPRYLADTIKRAADVGHHTSSLRKNSDVNVGSCDSGVSSSSITSLSATYEEHVRLSGLCRSEISPPVSPLASQTNATDPITSSSQSCPISLVDRLIQLQKKRL